MFEDFKYESKIYSYFALIELFRIFVFVLIIIFAKKYPFE